MLGRDPTMRLDFLRKLDANKMRLQQIENEGGTRDVTLTINEVCYVRDRDNGSFKSDLLTSNPLKEKKMNKVEQQGPWWSIWSPIFKFQ